MSRADTVIALVVIDTGHGATSNTRDALVSAGFTLSNILTTADSTATPACDIIVICRGISTQTLYDNRIKTAFESGTPVIFGSANGVNQGTGRNMAATFAKLTGGWNVTQTDTADVVVEDNAHPITDGQSLGQQAYYTANNWTMQLPDAATLSGQALLAMPDGIHSTMTNTVDLIPLEEGHLDLLGNPTAARCVLLGNVYGGQSAYTQLGIDLIGASIDWALEPIGGARRRSPLLLTPW